MRKYSEEYFALKKKLKLVKTRDDERRYIDMYERLVKEGKEYLAKQKKNSKEYYLAQDSLEKNEFFLKSSKEDLRKAERALAALEAKGSD